jgi:hypothetical protein
MTKKRYLFAVVSQDEYVRIQHLAKRDHQTLAAFVRSCLNDRLEQERKPLLESHPWGGESYHPRGLKHRS